MAKPAASPSNSRRRENRVALLLAIIALLLAFFFSFIEILDYDLWMHLASGRLIASLHSIPRLYPFAFTTDATWYYHEWLSALILYGLERLAGLAGLMFFRIALALATLYVLYRIIARTLPVWERFAVLFLAMLLLKERWIVRPYLFTTFFFALYLYYLLPPSRLKLRKIAILAGLMILWANLHGGFVFGILLVGIFFVEDALRWVGKALRAQEAAAVVPDLAERTRMLSLFLAFAFLASLVNPYFVQVYRVPVLLASYKLYHANIYEWFPPTFTIRYAHYWFMLFLTVAACLVTLRRLKVSLALLVALAGYLSVKYVRFFDLAAIVFAAALAQQLPHLRSSANRRFARSRAGRVRDRMYLVLRAAVTGAIVYLVVLHVWTFPYRHALAVRERSLPVGAVRFIKEFRLPQNLFNMYHWGGYLEWTLFPEYRVFIDGRAEVFGEKVFAEYGNALMGQPGWEATLDTYRVETALLSYAQIHPFARTETRLQEILFASPQWALVYWDDLALVFVRRTEANREIIARHEERAVNPLRYDWIRGLAGDKAKLKSAADALRRKIQAMPDSSLARVLLGQVLIELGERSEARQQLVAALKINPRSDTALSFLTIMAIEDGNAQEAFRYLAMRKRLGLTDKFYYNHKGAAYLLDRNYRAALRYFDKALAIDASFSEAQKNELRTQFLLEQRR